VCVSREYCKKSANFFLGIKWATVAFKILTVKTNHIPSFSVLDLSPIAQSSTASNALRNSLALAQHAEKLGYKRYWVAEHHGMPGIASAATSVVIGYIASGTQTIRVGAGGVMLPNHSPLVIAEQFGTLAALYPHRIDLGLGRAPGSNQMTARALRRAMPESVDQFPRDVLELQKYFQPAEPTQKIRATPGEGEDVPIWLLGSSLYSAQLAAAFGLPFAFASHFAPGDLMQAISLYRSGFQPSVQLKKPYLMLGVNIVAADSDAEARRQFTSQQQSFINLRRGMPGKVPAPIDDIESYWTPPEKEMVSHALACSFIGSSATIAPQLREFIAATTPNELMIAAHLHDHSARLRSYEIAAGLLKRN
jgi:luciferase family oxidoreductase group 1